MNLYKAFKENNIIEKEHRILRSGKHSSIYIEKTKITTIPTLYKFVINELTNKISEVFPYYNSYDIITGPAVAGICFAAPIALNLNKPFIFPEKDFYTIHIDKHHSCKKYKMKFRKEYEEILSYHKVIIIEDIITTGGSVIKTAQSIFENKGCPIAVFCIWNRNPKMKYIKYIELGESTSYWRFPIYSLISEKIEDWTKEECPICNKIKEKK